MFGSTTKLLALFWMALLSSSSVAAASSSSRKDFVAAMQETEAQDKQERGQRKLMKRLVEKAKVVRGLEEEDNYGLNLTRYALKYLGCQNIHSYSDDLAQEEDVEGVLAMDRFVVFRLCPKETCSSYNQWGCQFGYGEYTLPMEDYLELMQEYHMEQYQQYCAKCAACMTNAGSYYRDNNITDDNAVQQANENNNNRKLDQYYNNRNGGAYYGGGGYYKNEDDDKYNAYAGQNNNYGGNYYYGRGNDDHYRDDDDYYSNNANNYYAGNNGGNNNNNGNNNGNNNQRNYNNYDYSNNNGNWGNNDNDDGGNDDGNNYADYNSRYNYYDPDYYAEDIEEDDDNIYGCQYSKVCSHYRAACREYDAESSMNYENLQQYMACGELGDNMGYVGPHCRSDGYTIGIGIYSDENCNSYVGDLSSMQAYAGQSYDDRYLSAFYPKSCISCQASQSYALIKDDEEEEQEEGVYEACEYLYDTAAKCNRALGESNAYGYAYNQESNQENVCNFISSLVENNYDVYGEAIVLGEEELQFSNLFSQDVWHTEVQKMTRAQIRWLLLSMALFVGMVGYATYLHSRLIMRKTASYPWTGSTMMMMMPESTKNQPDAAPVAAAAPMGRVNSGITMQRSLSGMDATTAGSFA